VGVVDEDEKVKADRQVMGMQKMIVATATERENAGEVPH